ncbi:RNA polymerase-associated protein RapA [Rubripirellula tenax]|uniref:RNA polymerase-associated protein RapA n=1 Tax=Rubripirellula tenax TaxID=2528015 RepID=A0A5C6F5N0_9BACT|nr:DISARM system SNF2-like helicase DrmD [Rubripirellula tenax]TWU54781.1 RNA polymerase-associated protein RapA [Rubripirellula tenax]
MSTVEMDATRPEVGQAVQVRNRLATVRAVEPYDTRGKQGRLHIVEVEYLDDCRYPESEQVLWEVEATAKVLGSTSLPGVDANPPDLPVSLQSFVNAHRWTRLNRLRETNDIKDEPILGVWNSAIQVHPYQLEPVIRALSMPRVSLLLADGVGLGKTIQSGLVLEELLLRRRIRRVLVMCPAMLQRQWKIELQRKFNLNFEIIDSDSTFQLRRRMGIDTNPWKAFPRVITSMDYLRMPDVLQQFMQASQVGDDEGQVLAHAPWDLLIVDECHHFAPSSGSRASQRTRMLREIRFLFEHRLFASATPHNGKTVSFTGLLELLDPVRFQMHYELDDNTRSALRDVRIRRLKDDINANSLHPPFAHQHEPESLEYDLSDKEVALYAALRKYRNQGEEDLKEATGKERWLGKFIYSLLTKRLLSCPLAFARTWWRHVEPEPEESEEDDLGLFKLAEVSAQRADDQLKSDEERSVLEDDTARYGGLWFRKHGGLTNELQDNVGKALEALGYDRETVEDEAKLGTLAKRSDSKTDRLVQWVEDHLFVDGNLRDDERLLVFTEYKETLFYLEERFKQLGFDKNTLRMLFGGMNAGEFESVKNDFEDAAAPVRLMLATDAASEGINMQEECRWIIHYDIPWSPSKLQQRNGRVSRHGQMRDVHIHYFRSGEDEDSDFLFKVAAKVERVRQDLGSVERIFEAAIQRHFSGRETSIDAVNKLVDQTIEQSQQADELGQSSGGDIADLTRRARELLESTDDRLGISAEGLIEILKTSLTVEGAGSLDEIIDRPGFFRLRPPPRWEGLAKQSLSVGPKSDRMEIVFDGSLVEREKDGRRIMRVDRHQCLMRLGHPIMRQAMTTLCRQLHDPTSKQPIFRWSVAGMQGSGFEAL